MNHIIDAAPRAVALVAEDESLLRMDTVDLLADAGFRVLEAWNAQTALAQLEQNPDVSLLLTDVQMPGDMNGFELARLVEHRFPEVAIVVVSGNATPRPGDIPKTARFFEKPFSPVSVLSAIRGLTGAS